MYDDLFNCSQDFDIIRSLHIVHVRSAAAHVCFVTTHTLLTTAQPDVFDVHMPSELEIKNSIGSRRVLPSIVLQDSTIYAAPAPSTTSLTACLATFHKSDTDRKDRELESNTYSCP